MRAKRSRDGGSLTHHATPLETNASASLSPAKIMKPSEADAAEKLQPKILNAVSPVVHQSASESNQLKMGGFLERCHYFWKRIAQNSEVFMYRNFYAFCSAECRDFQLAKDQLVEAQWGNPEEKIVPGQRIYNVEAANLESDVVLLNGIMNPELLSAPILDESSVTAQHHSMEVKLLV